MSDMAIYRQPTSRWEYCGEGKATMKEGKFFSQPISSGSDFLRAELLVGLTRAAIAQKASSESKRERNRIEARKAYGHAVARRKRRDRHEACRVEILTSVSWGKRLNMAVVNDSSGP